MSSTFYFYRLGKRRSEQGFSLMELLVVVAIIGLGSMLSVAWLGSGNSDNRLRGVAHQLAGEFRLAGNVATSRQQVIGWQPVADGYQFMSWQPDGRWQPWGTNSGLAPTRWPLPVQPERSPVPSSETALPWLIWWPDGEVLGAQLTLNSDTARQTIEVTALSVSLLDGSHE